MSFTEKYQKDPFRLFFLVGFIYGILGILPWTFLLHSAIYPVVYHRMVMIGCFLTSFVTGFLMTATPRFTQSHFATVKEISVSFLFILLSYIAALFSNEMFFYFMASIAQINLAVFAIRRFLVKKSNPPSTFIFIGLGFLIWIVSNVMLFLFSTSLFTDPNWYLLFKNLWIEGAILSFILGAGGRLLPGIMGRVEVVQFQRNIYEKSNSYLSAIPKSLFLMIVIYVSSFFVEVFLNLRIGFMMRLLVVSYFAFKFWNIHKLPNIKNYLTYGLWLSAWCFVIGYLLRAFWLSGGVHALHLILIGGFSLLTILIATRVTLAHSSVGTSLEKKSLAISIITFLILISTLTRVVAIIWPPMYFHHLAYAAILWVLASIIWLSQFIKILIGNNQTHG